MPPTQGGKSVGNRPLFRWINVVLEHVIGGCFSRWFHQIVMFCIWKVANMFKLFQVDPGQVSSERRFGLLILMNHCHHGSSFRILINQCLTSTQCRLETIFIDLRYRMCGKMCKLKQWSATSGRDCRIVAAEAEYSSFKTQFHHIDGMILRSNCYTS